MADRVSIEVFGDEFFQYRMRSMARRAIDARPVMESIGQDFLDMIEWRFQNEGGYGTDHWDQLTIEYASKRGSAHPILIDQGDMFLAVTNPDALDVQHDGVRLDVPESEMLKAESAQYGFTSRAGKKIRPRKFININPADRYAMTNKISHFLATGEVGHLYDFAD